MINRRDSSNLYKSEERVSPVRIATSLLYVLTLFGCGSTNVNLVPLQSAVGVGESHKAPEDAYKVTVACRGRTLNDCREQAFREAILQTCSVFVSTRVDIGHNELISDKIAVISSGAIKSSTLLASLSLADGSYAATYQIVVSPYFLREVFNYRVDDAHFDGNNYAAQIRHYKRQHELNLRAETMALRNMEAVVLQMLDSCFDFKLSSGKPVYNGKNESCEIPLTLDVTLNSNVSSVTDYIRRTITALEITKEEAKSYGVLGEKTFSVIFGYWEPTISGHRMRTPEAERILHDTLPKKLVDHGEMFQILDAGNARVVGFGGTKTRVVRFLGKECNFSLESIASGEIFRRLAGGLFLSSYSVGLLVARYAIILEYYSLDEVSRVSRFEVKRTQKQEP